MADAIRYHYDVDFSSQQINLADGYGIVNGQIFRYNLEYYDFYFGKDFYVKKGVVYPINKNYEIVMDNMIFNLRDKKFYSPIDFLQNSMSELEKLLDGKKVSIRKRKDKDNLIHHIVCADGVEIFDEAEGCLRSVFLPDTESLEDYHFYCSRKIESFSAPKLKKIGRYFLTQNKRLKTILLPEVVSVGHGFLSQNKILKEIHMPKLQAVGQEFLACNRDMKKLSLPSLLYVDIGFLEENIVLEELDLPSLRSIEGSFLQGNEKLSHLNLPSLEEVGESFMISNNELRSVDLHNLVRVNDCFLISNTCLKSIELPKLRFLGSAFLVANEDFVLDVPLLKTTACADDRIGKMLRNVSRHEGTEKTSKQFVIQKQR